MSREIVHTPEAPGPFQDAPYSQAVRAHGFVFVAGQLGLLPGAPSPVEGGIGPQTAQALENLERILLAAGSSLERVIKTTVFLQRLDDFAGMNEVYAARFPAEPPARSTVEVARLPSGALVEIEAVALAGEGG
jgi:2-iminobutanoate/2-iminopropanoate deaminase